ncbi:MAG TPA: alpha/beta fold hydrolase [Candidatus Eisenbacteria bacterium]|nr:alpha/beta fold hydrolase [Candidatus Eisenbacteria bacterium]
MTRTRISRRVGISAAIAAAPIAAAWRFAHAYRVRAGYPRRRPPILCPADVGLPYEDLTVPSGDRELPAWWIPARDGAPGPAVVLVHGWESARDGSLPNAQVLHAAGFHVLAFDVRAHGENPAEPLPLTAGEFGADALAAVRVALAMPEATRVAVVGHSMGAAGALLAAAAEPRLAAVVAVSGPADPYRLTRQTFHIAQLPIPDPIAYPLAWLTTRIFLAPRGHKVAEISATRAIAQYRGPILLVHGDADVVVPPSHLDRLARAARRSRAGMPNPAPVETLVIEGGHHSWLYELPLYRATIARFLATALGGPLEPDEAAAVAAAVPATRLPSAEVPFTAMDDVPGGIRTLIRAIRHSGRPPAPADIV